MIVNFVKGIFQSKVPGDECGVLLGLVALPVVVNCLKLVKDNTGIVDVPRQGLNEQPDCDLGSFL
nr:MAG TPA: hypothetical protein [Caudoviricetes sp.]